MNDRPLTPNCPGDNPDQRPRRGGIAADKRGTSVASTLLLIFSLVEGGSTNLGGGEGESVSSTWKFDCESFFDGGVALWWSHNLDFVRSHHWHKRSVGWMGSPSVHSAFNAFTSGEFLPECWQTNTAHIVLLHIHLILEEDQGQVVGQAFWVEVWMSDNVVNSKLCVFTPLRQVEPSQVEVTNPDLELAWKEDLVELVSSCCNSGRSKDDASANKSVVSGEEDTSPWSHFSLTLAFTSTAVLPSQRSHLLATLATPHLSLVASANSAYATPEDNPARGRGGGGHVDALLHHQVSRHRGAGGDGQTATLILLCREFFQNNV